MRLLTGLAIALFLCRSTECRAGDGRFQYARDAKKVVVQMSYAGGMIANPDPTPFFRIFGDGTVVVHRPSYTKQAGDYALKLSDEEMKGLLSSLAAKGTMTFDAKKVQQQKAAITKKRQEEAKKAGKPMMVSMVMDAATTVIEIHLDGYTPAGEAGGELTRVDQRISWYALDFDAKKFRELKPLQDLLAAVQELRALSASPKLKKRE